MTEISVIFHGGEPLLAPFDVWQILLEGLSRPSCGVSVSLSVQSNLWRLDDRFIDLFKKYRVSVGTSLDGPRHICDENRGEGYFDRTMSSVEKAERSGMRVGAIATVTKQTLPQAREILAFFRDRGINPVIHAAVKDHSVSVQFPHSHPSGIAAPHHHHSDCYRSGSSAQKTEPTQKRRNHSSYFGIKIAD